MSEAPGADDELETYFSEAMKDPVFRAAYQAARVRRERARRNPWNRLLHWVHAMRYPEIHRQACSCRRR